MGALFFAVRMLCGVLQVTHVLLLGSKEQAMFWCMLLLRLFLDARYCCRMSGSLSMFPVLLCSDVCVVQLSRLCVVFFLSALRAFLFGNNWCLDV